MRFELRVVLDNSSICPFKPLWRKKSKWFQWLHPWNTFNDLTKDKKGIIPVRFGNHSEAVEFVDSIEDPIEYNKSVFVDYKDETDERILYTKVI